VPTLQVSEIFQDIKKVARMASYADNCSVGGNCAILTFADFSVQTLY
jgi:hypothetical protein